jgi:hypothetical protein
MHQLVKLILKDLAFGVAVCVGWFLLDMIFGNQGRLWGDMIIGLVVFVGLSAYDVWQWSQKRR